MLAKASMASSRRPIHHALCEQLMPGRVSAPQTHSYVTAVCSEQASWSSTTDVTLYFLQLPQLLFTYTYPIRTVHLNVSYSQITIAGFMFMTDVLANHAFIHSCPRSYCILFLMALL